MKRLIALALVACGSPPAPGAGVGSNGSAVRASRCDAVRPRVEQLYRSEASAREPGRIAESVADNTAMVMNDCARAPERTAACIAAATSAADLEARCLAPLDDEGTEGDALAR